MTGKHNVLVKNRRIQYKFTIERNITILKGESATGKTTMIELIAEYGKRGEESGITLHCDKACVVLGAMNWKLILENTHDSIVFIDEGDDFVRTQEFADCVKKSDDYFVIATRASLPNLPYSIKEVYGIRNISGNKYQGTKRLYSEFYPIYVLDNPDESTPDCVVVEDSNSGYDFFKHVCDQYGIACISAGGNSSVEITAAKCKEDRILVIADGASFGPFIERLLDLAKTRDIAIYLPESFEWLILSSGLLNDSSVDKILESPAEYIESKEFFNWERFFTSLLVGKTKGTYLAYNKQKLNPVYLQKRESTAIMKKVPLRR